MKKLFYFSLIVIVAFSTGGFAQNKMKANLFSDYENLLDELQRHDAEVLSPEHFKKAVEYYKKASEEYDNKDKGIDEIKEQLQKCREEALKAKEVVQLAQENLQKTLTARDSALSANAPTFAPEQWDKAEEEFQEATSQLEDGDLDDAKEYGEKAYELFKRTELLAIKNAILGDARTQVEIAKREGAEEYCLQTFRHATTLLMDAESFIDNNPYSRDEATQKALLAAYEGRHAQYLARTIKGLAEDDANWESLILKFEEILSNLGTPFHYQPKFDNGFESVVKTLKAHIITLKNEQKRLLAENAELEERVNSLQESQASTSQALKKKEELEQKIEKVKSIFTSSEAEVIYQGDKLIIRLTGLQFKSGRAIIQPEYFALLTKVQRALHVFPDKYVSVNGHTDATGNARKNKMLSEQRAKAVAEYLIANMELSKDRIQYYGYGDLKPVASNKTRAGRLKNRRIEVVISLND